MKIRTILAVVSSALFLVSATGAEVKDADKALKINLKQALNQRHVHFDVHEGIVTLKGEVRTEQDRRMIDDLVRSTPGVAAVKNKIKVKFPSPGTSTYAPSIPPSAPGTVQMSVPVFTTPPPKVISPAPEVRNPPPVVVPDYPKLRIQASSEQDLTLANKIARELRPESLSGVGLDNVTITVRDGTAILQGSTDTRQMHDALITALQSAGGLTAIYDQLQTK